MSGNLQKRRVFYATGLKCVAVGFSILIRQYLEAFLSATVM